jgi:hypothetical protein
LRSDGAYLATDRGLWRFNGGSDDPADCWLEEREVVRVFGSQGQLRALVRSTTDRKTYTYTVHGEVDGSWQPVLSDLSMYCDQMVEDREGKLWMASNGHTLADPASALEYGYNCPEVCDFRRLLVGEQILVGVTNMSRRPFRQWGAILAFEPGDSTAFVPLIDRFSLRGTVNMCVAGDGAVWTFTD